MLNNRKSGILLHPVSLPSKFGIGDLGINAYKFVDFLNQTNQKLWQVLPLNPTTFGDSPYQSFSTFAGNELLISPELMAEDKLLDEKDICEFSFSKYSEKIDYEKVKNIKFAIFKKAFSKFQTSNDFDKFCSNNKNWLDDYTLFCSLKDYYISQRKISFNDIEFKKFQNETKNFLTVKMQNDYYFGGVWNTWEEDIANHEKHAIKKWSAILKNEINFYKFLQYIFFKQWNSLKLYAKEKGIEIIGDMPIFVAYDSSDVWSNKENYKLDIHGYPISVAGVPPDYFSETGQLWGNPIYNWDIHKKNNYRWWIDRISHLLTTVDYLRIDHFRGFESYWEIPFGDIDATGGKWIKGPGKDFFNSIIKSIDSLPIIAEDLGVITNEINALRDDFYLPGMKVLQFAFDDSKNNDYLPHNYVKNAVVYTGTHDNNTTNGWYKRATEIEKDNFRRYMNVNDDNPAWSLMRLASSSCANTVIFPLQDVIGLDEKSRFNTPGTSSDNWNWRFDFELIDENVKNHLKYITDLFKR